MFTRKGFWLAIGMFVFAVGCGGGGGQTWVDPTTGYEWQVAPSDNNGYGFTWQEAIDYCKGLDLGGHQDWHLPTISELRTLIRGCPATQTGGSCGVTDDCLEPSCRDDSCYDCEANKGPGPDGVYGPSQLNWLQPDYWNLYWSSSSVASHYYNAWYVYFDYGLLDYYDQVHYNDARCVRSGP